jgi:hypothetical protein
MWVLYDHPEDIPDSFVLRRFLIGGGPVPTPTRDALICSTPEPLRTFARRQGLICLTRNEGDHLRVVESWF